VLFEVSGGIDAPRLLATRPLLVLLRESLDVPADRRS
jgi:hypothetical protein